MTETSESMEVTQQEVVLNKTLDAIDEALRELGLTLEDMIEQEREIRGQLLSELYGIADGDALASHPR